MAYVVIGFIFIIGSTILREVLVRNYYKEKGGEILDEFDEHPILATMRYGHRAKYLAEKYYEPQHSLELADHPDWALSDEERKAKNNTIWRCSECGKTNSSATKMCSCGAMKS